MTDDEIDEHIYEFIVKDTQRQRFETVGEFMEVGIDTFISSDNPSHHFKGTDTHDILMKATMFGNFITRLLLL
jgi:hypothetical protein